MRENQNQKKEWRGGGEGLSNATTMWPEEEGREGRKTRRSPFCISETC